MKLDKLRLRQPPRLMIIPMIDIIFFLLVFFMMSTLYMIEQKSIAVQLPGAITATEVKVATVTITITSKDEIFLDQQSVAKDALPTAIKQYVGEANVHFLVNADKNAHHGTVVYVLDILRSMGVKYVNLAVAARGENQ